MITIAKNWLINAPAVSEPWETLFGCDVIVSFLAFNPQSLRTIRFVRFRTKWTTITIASVFLGWCSRIFLSDLINCLLLSVCRPPYSRPSAPCGMCKFNNHQLQLLQSTVSHGGWVGARPGRFHPPWCITNLHPLAPTSGLTCTGAFSRGPFSTIVAYGLK